MHGNYAEQEIRRIGKERRRIDQGGNRGGLLKVHFPSAILGKLPVERNQMGKFGIIGSRNMMVGKMLFLRKFVFEFAGQLGHIRCFTKGLDLLFGGIHVHAHVLAEVLQHLKDCC